MLSMLHMLPLCYHAVLCSLQLNIEDVHIRYEDDELIPDHPFAFGIVIRSLSAQSTDSEWVSYCLGIAEIVINIEI